MHQREGFPIGPVRVPSGHNRAARDWVCSMACWASAKKEAAGMSCTSLSNETGVGAGGGDGSLGLYVSMPGHGIRHPRALCGGGCVNCHLRSSIVGAVSLNFCRVRGGTDRTPLT